MTLQSLEEAWRDLPVEWDVIVGASPHDAAAAHLGASLSGEVRVLRGEARVEAAVAEAESRGRSVHRFAAGDAVLVEDPSGCAVVPLVDLQFTSRPSWNNYFPRDDGARSLRWDREFNPVLNQPLIVFTNWHAYRGDLYRARRRVLWMTESAEVYAAHMDEIIAEGRRFDLVITNDRDLAERLPRAALVPMGGCWIRPDDQVLGDKTRWCSMVTSAKDTLTGHRVRLLVADAAAASQGVDLFGRASEFDPRFKPLPEKSAALLPYMFSIVVENGQSEDYFTEKLIDCFRCGTVPIYWGATRVGEYFDRSAVLAFSGPEDLPRVLAEATPQFYWEHAAAIASNYRRAADYRVTEDRIAPLLRNLIG